MKPAQLSLESFSSLKKDAKFFGGSLLKGKRKAKRGIVAKRLYHLVLRSQHRGRETNMLQKARVVKSIVFKQGAAHLVEILDYANVGNHLHLLVRPRGGMKHCFTPFIRAISGLIARKMLGCERGRAQGLQYWEQRPYTRLVSEDRKSFGILKHYFAINKAEGWGEDSKFLRSRHPAALAFLQLIKEGPPQPPQFLKA